MNFIDRIGAFGQVYRGIWRGTTPVALKSLLDDRDVEEFLNEASVLKSLNHPNIVKVC